jgi:hypothetical protein
VLKGLNDDDIVEDDPRAIIDLSLSPSVRIFV